MGRPIKKTKMAGTSSGAAGQIAVTAYRPSGASLVTSTTAYIISQRGSKLFKISLEDSSTGVYCLKAVIPGSLSATPPNGSDGEFTVKGVLDDSTLVYIHKFFNNTVHYVTSGGTTGVGKYQLNTEGTDEAKVSGVVNIDVITDQ